MDSLDVMLLRGGEISMEIPLKGEKLGFSGGWAQQAELSD